MDRAKMMLGGAALGMATCLGAAEYEDAWGPPVGAALPPIAALDQHGVERDFASLAGENGLALFIARSADW